MKLTIIGYGKMGKAIEKLAPRYGFEISGIVSSDNADMLDTYLMNTDVAVEFTNPTTAPHQIIKCAEAKVPIVSGTTGWLDDYDQICHGVQQNNGSLLYASNFSLGVNLFFALNTYLARLMSQHTDYRASITETHHIHKKDAPSGTAITLANPIVENGPFDSWALGSKVQEGQLSIESIRRGNVIGDHEIMYRSKNDRIKITHESSNREGFAVGAILAAKWIIGKTGIFTMNDMLGIE